jgi:hypothetical protein
MNVRRTALGVMAGSALLGVPVMTAGIASANPTPSHALSQSQSCTTDGAASNSPGVTSGNVIQAPAFNCSDVFGSPAVNVTGPLISSPAATS